MLSALALTALIALAIAFFIGLPVLIIWLSNRHERSQQEALRATGTLCTAFVKSFRRVSMTQHKVLFEIQLPTGPIGREYMLSGLSDLWLAEVTALNKPVQVYARADANTILIA